MFWDGSECFDGPPDGYANRSNSQTSMPRPICSPTDSWTVLFRAVGQPTIFGTPLFARQRIKNSLSTT